MIERGGVTIMMALFDEEQIIRNYVARKEREAEIREIEKGLKQAHC